MATVKDIARDAGVSIGTVDRVLHGRGRFAAATAGRVRAAMERLGYRPNVFARQLSRRHAFRFGVLLPDPRQDNGYWRLALAGVDQARADLQSYPVEIACYPFDRYRPDTFRRQFQRLRDDGCDGMVCAPVLTAAARELFAAPANRLPCAFFDADVPGAPRLFFAGQDALAAGRLCGRLMSLLTLPGARILVVRPGRDSVHITRRVDGFAAFLDGTRAIRELEWDESGSAAGQYRRLDRLLNAEAREAAGIFVPDAAGHHAARFLERHYFPAVPPARTAVVAYDLTPANRAALNRGTIDFLIHQNPARQARECLRALFRMLVLQEKNGPDTLMLPIDVVSRENLAYCDGNGPRPATNRPLSPTPSPRNPPA